jgi:hypothetical protein
VRSSKVLIKQVMEFLLKLTFCVCVCVCVCERERERQRQRQTQRQRQREAVDLETWLEQMSMWKGGRAGDYNLVGR